MNNTYTNIIYIILFHNNIDIIKFVNIINFFTEKLIYTFILSF